MIIIILFFKAPYPMKAGSERGLTENRTNIGRVNYTISVKLEQFEINHHYLQHKGKHTRRHTHTHTRRCILRRHLLLRICKSAAVGAVCKTTPAVRYYNPLSLRGSLFGFWCRDSSACSGDRWGEFRTLQEET